MTEEALAEVIIAATTAAVAKATAPLLIRIAALEGRGALTPEYVLSQAESFIAASARIEALERWVAAWTPSPAGEPGAPGQQGEPGAQGPAGAKGADGKDGRDGTRGDQGEKGADGLAGRDGLPGVQGSAGRDGVNGERGLPGADGKDGLDGTLEGVVVVQVDERTIKFVRAVQDPDDRTVLGTVHLPVPLYRGVYAAGTDYVKGDAVTFGGSLWIATDATNEKPGAGETAWRLAVKAGRDGREGKAGPKGETGARGDRGEPGRSYS